MLSTRTEINPTHFGGLSTEPESGEKTIGSSAVALYPYTAQEDNEISFEEGEMIYNIDTTISDDWWEGTNIHNESGLFPAAYVQHEG